MARDPWVCGTERAAVANSPPEARDRNQKCGTPAACGYLLSSRASGFARDLEACAQTSCAIALTPLAHRRCATLLCGLQARGAKLLGYGRSYSAAVSMVCLFRRTVL